MVNDVKPGGVFMINCQWDFDELNHHLKADAKRYIAKNNIQLYTINAIDLAIKIGMGKRNNTILQSAFFSLAKVMPEEQAIQYMKDAATHSYLKKGQDVVDMNHKAIDLGATAYTKIDVPADWANAVDADEAVSYEARPSSSSRSRTSSIPWTRWTATACPFPPSCLTWTASGSLALPLTKSAALPFPFPRGTRRSAFSATTALTSARTPPSVPSLSPRKRPRMLLPMPRSSTSRPARARVFTSTRWPSPRSTVWAAAFASASARSVL